MDDPYDLGRFVRAQEGVYPQALAEIARGAKRSHWMWFVFPQIAGLGRSEMARAYAIASLDEARAYLAHPLLGARLHACIAALQDLPPTSAQAVFGPVDAQKLHSSLTVFADAGSADAGADPGGDRLFSAALARWFGGVPDAATRALLSTPAKPL